LPALLAEGKRVTPAAALLCCAIVGVQTAAAAQLQTYDLTPATTKLGLTVYALGLFPLPGQYASLSGTLQIDPGRPGFCRVSITVEQDSLHMADPERVRKALAPDMLDAARYPTMRYTGTCQGQSTAGDLTIRGITHPLALSLKRVGDLVIGEGSLIRRDYAVTGMPHLLGQLIKIHFSTTLPML
jgi:polyisoprenoid-binding protein YceI